MLDTRCAEALFWAQQELGQDCTIEPLAGDASFRRYFRLECKGVAYVLMDAPPEKENVQPFLHVLAWMAEAGLRTPELLAKNTALG